MYSLKKCLIDSFPHVLCAVYLLQIEFWEGLPCGSACKESACNAGDLGLIPGLGRSPGEGKGYPLRYSGLENSMDYTVHGVTKSWTQRSDFRFHFRYPRYKTFIRHVFCKYFLPIFFSLPFHFFKEYLSKIRVILIKFNISNFPWDLCFFCPRDQGELGLAPSHKIFFQKFYSFSFYI